MTTLQQLKDIIYFKYMKECNNRKIPEMEIGDGEFKIYYDIVKDELFKELNIAVAKQEITITAVTSYTEYALDSVYGGLVSHELVLTGSDNIGNGLEIKNYEEMPISGNLTSGTPNRIAIYAKSDGLHYVYLYPLSGYAGTLTIIYKLLSEIEAGAGASADLTKSIAIPLQYQYLLIQGIMAQLFGDLYQVYYANLENAKYYRAVPTKGQIYYSFGGLNDDDIDNGYSKNWNGE